jgi:hypothetical protein
MALVRKDAAVIVEEKDLTGTGFIGKQRFF